MAYETLNRLKWTGKLHRCHVIILHRGAPENRKTIEGRKITQIKKSHFYYKENYDEKFIPLHRVMEINIGGKTVWKRNTKKG